MEGCWVDADLGCVGSEGTAEDAGAWFEWGGDGGGEDGPGEFEAECEGGCDEGAVVLVFAACLEIVRRGSMEMCNGMYLNVGINVEH